VAASRRLLHQSSERGGRKRNAESVAISGSITGHEGNAFAEGHAFPENHTVSEGPAAREGSSPGDDAAN